MASTAVTAVLAVVFGLSVMVEVSNTLKAAPPTAKPVLGVAVAVHAASTPAGSPAWRAAARRIGSSFLTGSPRHGGPAARRGGRRLPEDHARRRDGRRCLVMRHGGTVAGLIHDIPSCKALTDRIMTEADAIIRQRLMGFVAG